MTGERNRWLTAFAVAVYGFLFAPIVILIIFSFNDARRVFVWRGFTTKWYGELFSNGDLLDAVFVTLPGRGGGRAHLHDPWLRRWGWAWRAFAGVGERRQSCCSCSRWSHPRSSWASSLLLFFLQLFDSTGSFGQLSIAHITFCISYVAITVRARAAGMNPQLEEAARDLGDSALGALWHVTLPLHRAGGHRRRAARVRPELRRLRRDGLQLRHRDHDAAALHLQRDQVRRLAGDQRHHHDHRGDHRDRAAAGVALGRLPDGPRSAVPSKRGSREGVAAPRPPSTSRVALASSGRGTRCRSGCRAGPGAFRHTVHATPGQGVRASTDGGNAAPNAVPTPKGRAGRAARHHRHGQRHGLPNSRDAWIGDAIAGDRWISAATRVWHSGSPFPDLPARSR